MKTLKFKLGDWGSKTRSPWGGATSLFHLVALSCNLVFWKLPGRWGSDKFDFESRLGHWLLCAISKLLNFSEPLIYKKGDDRNIYLSGYQYKVCKMPDTEGMLNQGKFLLFRVGLWGMKNRNEAEEVVRRPSLVEATAFTLLELHQPVEQWWSQGLTWVTGTASPW